MGPSGAAGSSRDRLEPAFDLAASAKVQKGRKHPPSLAGTVKDWSWPMAAGREFWAMAMAVVNSTDEPLSKETNGLFRRRGPAVKIRQSSLVQKYGGACRL